MVTLESLSHPIRALYTSLFTYFMSWMNLRSHPSHLNKCRNLVSYNNNRHHHHHHHHCASAPGPSAPQSQRVKSCCLQSRAPDSISPDTSTGVLVNHSDPSAVTHSEPPCSEAAQQHLKEQHDLKADVHSSPCLRHTHTQTDTVESSCSHTASSGGKHYSSPPQLPLLHMTKTRPVSAGPEPTCSRSPPAPSGWHRQRRSPPSCNCYTHTHTHTHTHTQRERDTHTYTHRETEALSGSTAASLLALAPVRNKLANRCVKKGALFSRARLNERVRSTSPRVHLAGACAFLQTSWQQTS